MRQMHDLKEAPIRCINIEMYKQHADKNHMIVLFVWDNTIVKRFDRKLQAEIIQSAE